MIVQIYEIQTPREAEKCIELGVDHLGSVLLSDKDWRQPILRETIRLSEGSHSKNSIIPLFQKIETIYRVLDYYQPHFIHLCESLTDNQGKERELHNLMDIQLKIKEKFPQVGIIRSIPIPPEDYLSEFRSLNMARKLELMSDLFLTDTWLGEEPVEGFIGITGKTCNWKIAKELVIRSRVPVILAGGISPENVYEALMKVAPAGVDSCTLTNRVDQKGNPVRFRKDFYRVKRFVEEARRFERTQRLK